MKMIFIPSLRWRAARQVDAETMAAWRRDPMSHPVLRSMDERELADLPFGQARFTATGLAPETACR